MKKDILKTYIKNEKVTSDIMSDILNAKVKEEMKEGIKADLNNRISEFSNKLADFIK